MKEEERHAVPLDDNLSRSRDRQVGLRLPMAVDEGLDRLRALAEDVGERTDRKELVAALISCCDLDGLALSAVLRRYRTMTVRDVMPQAAANAKVVRLTDHKPGPRSHRR